MLIHKLANIWPTWFLYGCLSYPPQQYAGVVHVVIDYQDGLVQNIRAIDGKENSGSALEIASGETVITFSADEVRAFDGQAARASVERLLAENGITPTDKLVDGIVSLVGTLAAQ